MCAKRDISDGRVDMWRTIALEKVSIVAIFCSAALTTPRYWAFLFPHLHPHTICELRRPFCKNPCFSPSSNKKYRFDDYFCE